MKRAVLVVCLSLFAGQSYASFWSWLGFGEKENKLQENKSQENKTNQDSHQAHSGSHDDHQWHEHHLPVAERQVGTLADFQLWQQTNPDEAKKAERYERYLKKQLGNDMPPLNQLLTSARSWRECGYEPYQVPPDELWSNMLPTLRLYSILKWRGILPDKTEIRSVYRSPELNRCAGGASGSKHITNSAIDIWVPDYGDNSWQLYQMKDKLCQFWKDEGQAHQFGLGLYATGAIHIDTQGYRKWGIQFSNENSICREVQEKLYIDGQF